MELATKADIMALKDEIVQEIAALLEKQNGPKPSQWVKSKKAREILGCSPGTLNNLRVKGLLEYTRIGGSLYYNVNAIMKLMEENKRNGN